ncbi:MAG: helix-turn-helix domain-containing protein [Actinomycetota bacterium]|nr:helix-turn-helix domain-containing protein [Actinomycetota bacterium]
MNWGSRGRQARGESVSAIARHLKIGRSTLYRALQPQPARDEIAEQGDAPPSGAWLPLAGVEDLERVQRVAHRGL